MTSGIYAIINIVNGNKYIGSTIDIQDRWNDHIELLNKNKHHSPHLQNAWNKYGSEAFKFEILEICDGIKELLLEREQFYIDNMKPVYNISPTAGSSLGIKRSDETRTKLSESHRGKKLSDETKAKMSEAQKGRKVSAETKIKLSEAFKGREFSAETKAKMSTAKKGKPSPRKGVNLSEETRKKISEVQKGRKASDETRARMRASNKHSGCSPEHYKKLSIMYTGKPLSEEHREKLSIAHMGNNSAHGNLGKKHSEEHNAKVSAGVKEWWRKRKEESSHV
jgi:group I intron endonuclease